MKNTLYPPSAGLALAVATPLLALLASLSPGRTVHAQTPTSNTTTIARAMPDSAADPFQWLEEVQGAQALAWVGKAVKATSLTPEGAMPGLVQVLISGRNLTLVGMTPTWAVRLEAA